MIFVDKCPNFTSTSCVQTGPSPDHVKLREGSLTALIFSPLILAALLCHSISFTAETTLWMSP